MECVSGPSYPDFAPCENKTTYPPSTTHPTTTTTPLVSCDDILEENARLKYEVKWLNDLIANNITQLARMIQENADNLRIVDTKVNANNGQIDQTKMRVE